jgi:hypothetical protein
MKLWLLHPLENLPKHDNPWEPWYDKVFGFVVRAKDEAAARELAHGQAGRENKNTFLNERTSNTTAPWKEAKYSTCVELRPRGPAEVVLSDTWSA